MSLPPEVLRIKRKRTDDPINSLYIEPRQQDTGNKKRTLYQDYVFRRQARENGYTAPQPSSIPQILATQPGDERKTKDVNGHSRTRPPPEDASGTTGQARRQFHLSRSGAAKATGKRKDRGEAPEEVAVLVEGPARKPRVVDGGDANKHSQSANLSQPESRSESPLKRPGAGARVGALTSSGQRQVSRSVETSLHEAMLRYAAETEGNGGDPNSLQQDEPKKDTAVNGHDKDSAMDIDDGDFVYDTFVRHAADSAKDDALVELDKVGYLILNEEDEELLETFADDDYESEKDWDSEQDDENAENYYGADYPEDEVEFEDEFDEDPYRYRRGTASDEEEFDEDDAWSDDEGYGHTSSGRYKSDSLRTPADLVDDEGLQ